MSDYKKINELIKEYDETLLISVKPLLSQKKDKEQFVLSSFTAASLWGFNPFFHNVFYLTAQKERVPVKLRKQKDIIVQQRVKEIYEEGIVTINYEGHEINVYEPEKVIIEIIKDNYKNMNDQLYKLIMMFRDKEYDFQKIHYYAEKAKILDLVKFAFGVWDYE